MGAIDHDERPTLAAVGDSIENHAIGMRWEVSPLGPEGRSFVYGLELVLDGTRARASRRAHIGVPAVESPLHMVS